MGYPLGYAEVFAPGLFLHLLCFLGHVHSLLLALFNSANLSDLFIPPDMGVVVTEAQALPLKQNPSRDANRSTMPVVRYDELTDDPPESCLYEIKGGCSIGRAWTVWIDCDQDKCPLHRARFVADRIEPNLPEPILFWLLVLVMIEGFS